MEKQTKKKNEPYYLISAIQSSLLLFSPLASIAFFQNFISKSPLLIKLITITIVGFVGWVIGIFIAGKLEDLKEYLRKK